MTQYPLPPDFQELPPELLERLEKLIAPHRLTEWQRAVLANQTFPRPPAVFPQSSDPALEPYLRVMRRDMLTLAQAEQIPIRFLTGAPIPLRDRMWARLQGFRRLLWKIQERLPTTTASSATGVRSLGRRSAVTLRTYLRRILSR